MDHMENRTETILKSELESTETMVNVSRPHDVEESLRLIDDLKYFLATAPANWQENQIIRRYYLNSEHGFVSCVFWNNVYYITGTDIVKCCLYRMQKFGRTIVQKKKFEEGIFSDLRNLKCGIDATLEQPKSAFLQFLYRNSCLKTQKKQKVFFWFSVPHDKLFADALERDLKREEVSSQQTTTKAIFEPAISFQFDSKCGVRLYNQLLSHMQNKRLIIDENRLEPFVDLESDDMYKSQEAALNLSPIISGDKSPPTTHGLSYNGIKDIGNKMNNLTNKEFPNNSQLTQSSSFVSTNNEIKLDNRKIADIDSPALNSEEENDYETNSSNPLESVNKYSIDDNCNNANESLTTVKTVINSEPTTNNFEDIPLDYFPIDIEYPKNNEVTESPSFQNYMTLMDYNVKDAEKATSTTSAASVKKKSIKVKKHTNSMAYQGNMIDPLLLNYNDGFDVPSNAKDFINLNGDADRMHDNFKDVNDAFEEFNNDLFQQRINHYNTQYPYNSYMNLNIPQMTTLPTYQSEILPQTIDPQPFTRFDNIFTPQSVYKDYIHMSRSQNKPQAPLSQQQIEFFDWNVLLQPTSNLPQLSTARSLTAYTPGYRANMPQTVWIQSPYMTSGPNQYPQTKTPLITTRRRQFHNLTPATSMNKYSKINKNNKVTKPAHDKKKHIAKEKQSIVSKKQ